MVGSKEFYILKSDRYAIYMTPQYKVWRDLGDNVGIQCLVCNKTHWTGRESTIDPTTNAPCSNCEMIKTQNVRQTEQQSLNHAEDISSYARSQPVQTIEASTSFSETYE